MCVCWSKTATGSQMLVPALSSNQAYTTAPGICQNAVGSLDHRETDESGCGWSKPFLLLPPQAALGWVLFSLLIEMAPLCGKPSLCLSMFVFSNSSSDKSGKGQAWSFWMKDLEGFSQSTCPVLVPQDSGWFKGLQQSPLCQDSWGVLEVTGLS